MLIKLKKLFIEKIKNDKKLIFISLLLGFLLTSVVTYTITYSESVQKGIAGEVLRFHVLANSDSDFDQNLKIKVRDGILEKYKNELQKCKSVGETKKFFNDNINSVVSTAKEIIKSNGFDYNVKAFLGRSVFPTKAYGDVTFPAGEYEALKIEIGEAKGKNWWCVMFPPLCFVDVSCKKINDQTKQELKNILTEEEYGIVVRSEKEPSFKIKFKIVELWEELFSNS